MVSMFLTISGGKQNNCCSLQWRLVYVFGQIMLTLLNIIIIIIYLMIIVYYLFIIYLFIIYLLFI